VSQQPPAAPAVEIRGLSVQFGGLTALNDVSLTVPAQSITVVVGPSGAGKTTLLRAINRLNECFAGCRTAGSVRVQLGGASVDVYGGSYPPAALRRQAAMVFQTPSVLPLSVARNFAVPLGAVLGLGRGEIAERMEHALREVQLYDEVKDRLHAPAQNLSGGQQQRLCLARALALRPSLLLLDEPTANLDFRVTRQIEELLVRLKTQYTILAVSHSLGQTRRLADHVAVLSGGCIVRTLDRSHLRDAAVFESLVEEVF
jgi:phosphate transport system ATP-binding protein